jgi:hypothetical protein
MSNYSDMFFAARLGTQLYTPGVLDVQEQEEQDIVS